jgi:hypothetical protein
MWRSTGLEFGTELDAPAGPKKGANVYVLCMLRLGHGEARNAFKGFLVAAADKQGRARIIVLTTGLAPQ